MKIGIDLGGSHIAVGLIESSGKVLSKKEVQILKEDEKNIIDIIENYIFGAVEEFSIGCEIDKVGIAIPGTVSDTTIVKSVNLGIEDYNIVKALARRIIVPIHIKNDAKCAAIAENTYGSLKNYKNALFLTIGTGIGGAVIYDNRLISPEGIPGFEFGHMIIKQNGKSCKCGKRGCFEQYCSMRAFKQRIIEELELDNKIDGEKLLNVVEEKKEDPVIANIIDEYLTDLSIGISNLINIFEPQAVGIGGSFVYFADLMLPKLKEKILSGNLLFNKRDDIVLKAATLGNDAGMIGASLI